MHVLLTGSSGWLGRYLAPLLLSRLKLLIVDEALSVGDAAFQRKCLDWIDSFKKQGTLLFVSHSLDQVRRLCDHTIWIDNGRIREQGEPHRVIRSYVQATREERDDVGRFSAADH